MEFAQEQTANSLVLDLGSAGHAYFSTDCMRVDVDLADTMLTRCPQAVCASIEALPFKDNIAYLVLCVGPVVNYCSLEESINELARITKLNGRLILHVELSNSYEFLVSKSYRADAAFVTSFYKGVENYWVYSNAYVRRILDINGFLIQRVRYFHILSSLFYRMTGLANFSARLAPADPLFSWISACGSIADSAIFVCRRTR